MLRTKLSRSTSRCYRWDCLIAVALLSLLLLPLGANAQVGKRKLGSTPPPGVPAQRNGANLNAMAARNAAAARNAMAARNAAAARNAGMNRIPPRGAGRMPGTPNSAQNRSRSSETVVQPGRGEQRTVPNGQPGAHPGPGSIQGQPGANPSRSGALYQYNYNNGVYGRTAYTFYPRLGNYWYPGYYSSYVAGTTYYSPYSYYPGIAPAYIGVPEVLSAGVYAQPQFMYLPAPYYNDDNVFDSYQNNGSNGSSQSQSQPAQPQSAYKVGDDAALDGAIKDIEDAWMTGDIQRLAVHVQKDSKIAVYQIRKGLLKYQYSLAASDYLDLTRDALKNIATVKFALDTVICKMDGVYAVAGTHIYKNERGNNVSVHVGFALQKDGAEYYITQVGTAPDNLSSK